MYYINNLLTYLLIILPIAGYTAYDWLKGTEPIIINWCK